MLRRHWTGFLLTSVSEFRHQFKFRQFSLSSDRSVSTVYDAQVVPRLTRNVAIKISIKVLAIGHR